MADETIAAYRKRLGIASFPQGTLVAEWGDNGLSWTLRDHARSQADYMRQVEWRANFLSNEPFQYNSPAYGEPGFEMAAQVAAKLGAEWSPDDSTSPPAEPGVLNEAPSSHSTDG